MTGIKEIIEVNSQSAILGIQEGGFSFLNQFGDLPTWKRIIILIIAIAIIPAYLIARFGTEQYLIQKYGRTALTAQPAFKVSQNPVVDTMQIIRNPNNTYSAVVLVSNPNIELSADNISYTATFQNSEKQTVYSTNDKFYLLPNEKKYIVFPRIESGSAVVVSGSLELSNINWQKRLNTPQVELRASEPLMYDQANPLTFVAEGSIINNSPYQVRKARIVFLLFDNNNKIIGVSQRDESSLLPFGRRAYKQLWPGLYRSQIRKVQAIVFTNTLDPLNISTSVQSTLQSTNSDSNTPIF